MHAVRDLTLDIHDREFFVLLGPTGAGKSTTLRCIAGLEQPQTGDILIAGERVNDWSAAQRDVALVFQQYSLYPNYTVRENLAFPLKSKLRNLSARSRSSERVAKAAATVRITHLLERRTDRLSGGEMQRVSIGRAIVREPRVFLMDEPLSNLDAKLRELLRAELKGLQQRLGTTLVFVTHDQVEAMTHGRPHRPRQQGRAGAGGHAVRDLQLAEEHLRRVLRRHAGDQPARRAGRPGAGPWRTTARSRSPSTRRRARRLAPLLPADGKVRLGIRPENVALVAEGGMAGAIYGAENHGAEIIAVIEAGGHRLRATVPAKTPTALNQPVQIAFAQDKLHFFHPAERPEPAHALSCSHPRPQRRLPCTSPPTTGCAPNRSSAPSSACARPASTRSRSRASPTSSTPRRCARC